MQIINGYEITKDLSAENAGFCKWGFAQKNGHEYFIKEFLSPKYPLDEHMLSEKALLTKRNICMEFSKRKQRVYDTLEKCRTGNVVYICDFFREGTKYYAVTDKVTDSGFSLEEISQLPNEKKFTLFCSILYSFAAIHREKLIHADIKPDNILIKKTEMGYYTAKIIDFDAAFFEDAIPDEIMGDQVYLAPEVRLRMMEEPIEITTKADIFALGILLHQYWCGKMPIIPDGYDSVFEAVLDDAPVTFPADVPKALQQLFARMLSKNAADRPSASLILSAFQKVQNKILNKPDKPIEKPVVEIKKEKGFRAPDALE